MGEGNRLDDLARELANGSISRRTALRRLAAGALGIGIAAAPSALAEELERGRCPKERRCNGKCCPRNSRCRNGKCKCKSGFTKCGRKCVDLQSSAKHCGACGNTCEDGRACIGGQCEECVTPDDCPAPGDCRVATCNEGVCGSEFAPDGTFCGANGTCESGTCVESVCGNGLIESGEDCDGADLAGQTCESQGFSGGTLACGPDCFFDYSACT